MEKFQLVWQKNRLSFGVGDPHHTTDKAGTYCTIVGYDSGYMFSIPEIQYTRDTQALMTEMINKLNS